MEIATYILTIIAISIAYIVFIKIKPRKPNPLAKCFIDISYKHLIDIPTILKTTYTLPAYPAQYIYVNTVQQLKKAVTEILTQKVIGLDTENDSFHSYYGCTCLIQISTILNNYIIDAIQLKQHIRRFIKPIFESDQIIKVLFDANSDSLWIQRDYNITLNNICDIKLLSDDSQGSLVNLWGAYCKFNFDKKEKEKFQMSDWYVRPLTKEQLNYSYVDSHFLIYLRAVLISKAITDKGLEYLQKQYNKMQATTQIKYNKALFYHHCRGKFNKDNETLHYYVLLLTDVREKYCQPRNLPSKVVLTDDSIIKTANAIVEKKLEGICISDIINGDSNTKAQITKEIQTISAMTIEQVMECKPVKLKLLNYKTNKWIDHNEKSILKAKRKEKIVQKYSRKEDVYQNCTMYSPSGEMLCICDRKKAEWYVLKKLATLKSSSPYVIVLNFEPNGRLNRSPEDIDGDNYYTKIKLNRCVRCGNTKDLVKFHIVPIQFRRYFPNDLKSHRCHDVLLMCYNCQEVANKAYEVYKKEIFKKFGLDESIIKEEGRITKKVQKAKSIANKIVITKDANVKQVMYESLFSIYMENKDLYDQYPSVYPTLTAKDYSEVLVKFILIANVRKEILRDAGEQVVKNIKSFEEFIHGWRKYFLESLKPKCMPDGWKVEHKVERSFGSLSAFNESKV